MNWFNGLGDVFEKELLDFFINDKYEHIVLPEINGRLYASPIEDFNFGTTMHTHTFLEIAIVLEGECLFQLEDRLYSAAQGDIVIVKGNLPHRERARELYASYKNAYICFEDNRIWFFITRYDSENGFKFTMASHTLLLEDQSILNQIRSEIAGTSPCYEEFFYSFLKALYLYVYRNKMMANTQNITVDRISDTVLAIEQYMKKNFMSRTIIKDMCLFLKMSEPSLCNFVKKYMNVTLSQYINRIRIEHAKSLLTKTDRKVLDVANTVGYNDQYYFSKIFRLYEGMAPTEFRARRMGA